MNGSGSWYIDVIPTTRVIHVLVKLHQTEIKIVSFHDQVRFELTNFLFIFYI
jgi:hypothetical protein